MTTDTDYNFSQSLPSKGLEEETVKFGDIEISLLVDNLIPDNNFVLSCGTSRVFVVN